MEVKEIKLMSAKEMAIDLDMKVCRDDENELVYKNIYNEDLYVTFYKKDKAVGGNPYYDYFCDMPMFKFINKQIKELGWIE